MAVVVSVVLCFIGVFVNAVVGSTVGAAVIFSRFVVVMAVTVAVIGTRGLFVLFLILCFRLGLGDEQAGKPVEDIAGKVVLLVVRGRGEGQSALQIIVGKRGGELCECFRPAFPLLRPVLAAS